MSSDTPLDGPASTPRVPAPLDADNSEALLAELDSLLERMMALPVNNLDEGPGEPEIRPEPPPNMPVITVTETRPEPVSSLPPPAVMAVSDDLYVQALLHEKAEELPQSRPPDPVAIWKDPSAVESEPAAPALAVSTQPPQVRAVERESAPWLQPLLWCNRLFDNCTAPLGAPGRWLRQPGGRLFLGCAGLLMLAAVGGLALCDCLGWTW